MVELFLADRAGADQRLAPGHVVLGPRDLAARARQIGLAQLAICACSAPLLTNSVRTSRTVCASCASAWSSATCASAGSSLTSSWPALHEVGVVGVDRDDGAADLRRQLDDVALHVGVVGRLVVAERVEADAMPAPTRPPSAGLRAAGARRRGGGDSWRERQRARFGAGLAVAIAGIHRTVSMACEVRISAGSAAFGERAGVGSAHVAAAERADRARPACRARAPADRARRRAVSTLARRSAR